MAVLGRGYETFQIKGLRQDLAEMIPKLTQAQFDHLIQFHRYDTHVWAWQDATIHDAHIGAWWLEMRKTA